MPKAKSKSRQKVEAAMHEVFIDEPSTVTRAKVSDEKKTAMKKAIAFSKARKTGARVTKK